MTPWLLDPANRPLLERLAWSNLLVALDLDGTLIPLLDGPPASVLAEPTRRLLVEVACRYPCVVISGRAQVEVAQVVEGIPLAACVGSHGAELAPLTAAQRETLARLRRVIEERLAGLPGVVVEDKGASLVVHHGRAHRKKPVRSTVDEVVDGFPEVRAVGGKQAINLLPVGGPHKGTALGLLRARLGCDTALYLGDDDTDEDVFLLDEPGRLFGVRVEERTDSAAHLFLRSRTEVDEVLRLLVAARRDPADHRQEVEPSPPPPVPVPARRGPFVPALGETGEFLRLLWSIDHGLEVASRAMGRSCGLTGPQRLVLRFVGRFPGISAGTLSSLLHLDPSTLTPTLKRLEERGLLGRWPDRRDARQILLGLTPAGQALDVPAPHTIEQAVASALATASAAQVQAARELMTTLGRALLAAAQGCDRGPAAQVPAAAAADQPLDPTTHQAP